MSPITRDGWKSVKTQDVEYWGIKSFCEDDQVFNEKEIYSFLLCSSLWLAVRSHDSLINLLGSLCLHSTETAKWPSEVW